MKKVFVSENPGLVHTAKNLLEQNGIACVVRNEFASGGVGELAFFDAWPELWLLQDEDADTAERLLKIFDDDAVDESEEWLCSQCGESNAASFDVCWKCGWEHLS